MRAFKSILTSLVFTLLFFVGLPINAQPINVNALKITKEAANTFAKTVEQKVGITPLLTLAEDHAQLIEELLYAVEDDDSINAAFLRQWRDNFINLESAVAGNHDASSNKTVQAELSNLAEMQNMIFDQAGFGRGWECVGRVRKSEEYRRAFVSQGSSQYLAHQKSIANCENSEAERCVARCWPR